MIQDTSSDDDSDSQEGDGTEDDSEMTSPLLDEIRNGVNGALSATGMPR